MLTITTYRKSERLFILRVIEMFRQMIFLFSARGRSHLLKLGHVLWGRPIKLTVPRVEKEDGDVFHVGHVFVVLLQDVSGLYVAPLIGWLWVGFQPGCRFSPRKVRLAKIFFDFRHGHGQLQLRIFVKQLLLTTLRSSVRLPFWQSRLLIPIQILSQSSVAFSLEDHVGYRSLSRKKTAAPHSNCQEAHLNHFFAPLGRCNC